MTFLYPFSKSIHGQCGNHNVYIVSHKEVVIYV
nr:MAG TPA: hypothetical protein [Caudoviricetes sp.]DAX34785.1 MAG TPA: hypothetical protein [Caudoviricetes sp.]